MTGREHVGAELARRDQQVVKFDRHIALDARNRCLPVDVALGETVDHRLLEARLGLGVARTLVVASLRALTPGRRPL